MKNAFSKEDREFQEMLMRNAAKQDLYGGAGNELAQDIVEDIIGRRKVLSSVGTMTKIDEYGMPYVYRERVGKILDCGHMAYSLEGFLGECFYGHTVCNRCQLYTCDWCGVKLCDKCVQILENGVVLCGGHEGRRYLKMAKALLLG